MDLFTPWWRFLLAQRVKLLKPLGDLENMECVFELIVD